MVSFPRIRAAEAERRDVCGWGGKVEARFKIKKQNRVERVASNLLDGRYDKR